MVRRGHELKLLRRVMAHLLLQEELLVLGIVLLLELPLEVPLFLRELLIRGSEPALQIDYFVLHFLLLLNGLRLLVPQSINVFLHAVHFGVQVLQLLATAILSFLCLGLVQRQLHDLLLLLLELTLHLLPQRSLLLEELDERVQLLRHRLDPLLGFPRLRVSPSVVDLQPVQRCLRFDQFLSIA